MSKAVLCAALFASMTPAAADELRPPSAPAHDIACYPLADLKAFLDGAGGELVQLTPEQFQFARGVYVAAPPPSTALPPGDRAGLAMIGAGSELLFIDRDLACDAGALPPPLRQMLLDVGAGRINHVGGGA